MHLKICHIGGYEGKILSDAPNYLMDNLSCKLFEAKIFIAVR